MVPTFGVWNKYAIMYRRRLPSARIERTRDISDCFFSTRWSPRLCVHWTKIHRKRISYFRVFGKQRETSGASARTNVIPQIWWIFTNSVARRCTEVYTGGYLKGIYQVVNGRNRKRDFENSCFDANQLNDRRWYKYRNFFFFFWYFDQEYRSRWNNGGVRIFLHILMSRRKR